MYWETADTTRVRPIRKIQSAAFGFTFVSFATSSFAAAATASSLEVSALQALFHFWAYYQDLAQARNPLLSQVSLKRELAQEGVRAQRADFLPQVAAIGGGSFYNYQVAGLVPRWAVGVGVNIKIFDGLNREYKYSAAKQTVRRVGELQNKAGKDIAVLVEKLYNQMMNYHNQMTSIDASLKFAEEYLRMKNAAFLEGMSSSSDLIDAELNLAGVRTERLQAAYNYDLLLARLLEAAGISDEYPSYARRNDAQAVLFDGSRSGN